MTPYAQPLYIQHTRPTTTTDTSTADTRSTRGATRKKGRECKGLPFQFFLLHNASSGAVTKPQPVSLTC